MAYETKGSTWGVNNGKLDFGWQTQGAEFAEAKLRFTDTGMSNGAAEMEIEITEHGGPDDIPGGTAGIMIRSDNYVLGDDKFDGFYVGVGKGRHGDERYHVEWCWFDQGSHGADLEAGESGNNGDGGVQFIEHTDGPVKIAVTMIGGTCTFAISDLSSGNVLLNMSKKPGTSFPTAMPASARSWPKEQSTT